MRHDSDTATLVAEFKSDPEKLRHAEEFVDQLIQQAIRDAEKRQKAKDRSKYFFADVRRQQNVVARPMISSGRTLADDYGDDEEEQIYKDDDGSDSGNLKRRLGRARGFVLRMFDALCNCTQTAAAAARTTARTNPFAKR